MSKTKGMLVAEGQLGEPLETLIPRLIQAEGTMSGAARRLGVTGGTLTYWCLRLGIRVEKRAVVTGQEMPPTS